MFFSKRKKDAGGGGREDGPSVDPDIFRTLESLEKAGAQLSLRFTRHEAFTSTILGLGRDGFFIDTLSPPTGDRQAIEGRPAQIETLLDGESFTFRANVLGKVGFLDDMPAFKLSYPEEVKREQRRKNRRHHARNTSRLTFTRPFDCEGNIIDIGEGGLAFEYNAELGRLTAGTRIGGALLEMGQYGTVEIGAEVVGVLVASLGGLSLPSTYRAGVRFVSLTETAKTKIGEYLKSLEA